ncbi:LOW QUALITY PROTEIN: putative RNA-binding protein 19 [Urocitellus parryii]
MAVPEGQLESCHGQSLSRGAGIRTEGPGALSRLIMKNLLNGMKEEGFRQLFAFVVLTHCSLKFTKDGKFRKFGFIGFKSEEEAQAALNHFNKSFIDTSRITATPKFPALCCPSLWLLRNMTSSLPPALSAEQGLEAKAAAQRGLSDMEYLKSKVVAAESSSSKEEEGEDEAVNCDRGSKEEESPATPDQPEQGSPGTLPGRGRPKEPGAQTEKPANQKEPTTAHTVNSVTEKNVLEFLMPLKPVAIGIVRNELGNKTGYVFVDFSSEEEVKRALKCNREYMGGRYIKVFREKQVPMAKGPLQKSAQPWQGRTLGENEEEENLAGSGRLFVRNLPYTSTEEDLEKLFSTYGRTCSWGPLFLPWSLLIGLGTCRPVVFAFVTFMFPEHSVKAYVAMDGQVFQGRMLHVLPSTIRKEASEDADVPSSSYRKKKASEDKARSSSSHNWNTLFMGPNAVADAIAQKYSATKQVFDHETKGRVAVLVALWETQLVQEVWRFLIDNGVILGSFSQAAAERSKTVILAKNLLAGTLAAELRETFSCFGRLGRVLLPEGGVTVIVEFLEPLEARKAFRHLAYSKFHHVPLYLEWAPVGVFSSTAPQGKEPQEASAEKNMVEPETGATAGELATMLVTWAVPSLAPALGLGRLHPLRLFLTLTESGAHAPPQNMGDAACWPLTPPHEPSKKKRSVVLDGILEQLEDSDRDDKEQTLQL